MKSLATISIELLNIGLQIEYTMSLDREQIFVFYYTEIQYARRAAFNQEKARTLTILRPL